MVKPKLSCKINVATFIFFIVCMPNFHSNIPSSVFYGTMMPEILRIARSSCSFISFYEKTSALVTCMDKQGGNNGKLINKL